MFKSPLDRSVRECVAELREHVTKLAESQLDVAKNLLDRVARLEMQMRQPRVCIHEPSEDHTTYVCKHCRSLYVPKE